MVAEVDATKSELVEREIAAMSMTVREADVYRCQSRYLLKAFEL